MARGLAAFSSPPFNGPRSMMSPPSPESRESQSSEAWRRALGSTTSMIVRASLGTSDQATPDAPIVCRPGDLLVAGALSTMLTSE